jgi:hypothetical protein
VNAVEILQIHVARSNRYVGDLCSERVSGRHLTALPANGRFLEEKFGKSQLSPYQRVTERPVRA